MEEQASAGDLLQPTSADFLGLLKVLGVRAVWVLLPGYTVELIEVTKSLSDMSNNSQKFLFFTL